MVPSFIHPPCSELSATNCAKTRVPFHGLRGHHVRMGMRRGIVLILLIVTCSAFAAQEVSKGDGSNIVPTGNTDAAAEYQTAAGKPETRAEHDARMAWWRDAMACSSTGAYPLYTPAAAPPWTARREPSCSYRDYLVSPDTGFLKRNWPQIKLATQRLMSLDSDKDSILDLAQSNTLYGTWYGKIPWVTCLGLAAVQASGQMALVMGDTSFAETCKQFVKAGKSNFVKTFWNGEYFEQIHDPAKLEHVGSYNGCLIDQVMGQGWAFQVGLDCVLPEEKTKKALNAIWKYNFAPDVGPFRGVRPIGRWRHARRGRHAHVLMAAWRQAEGYQGLR